MKVLKITLLVAGAIFLTACEPQYFGMPQSQWQQLTPAQQQQVIQSYNRRQEIKQQNAPLQSAIDAAGDIFKQKEANKAVGNAPYVPNMNSGFPDVHPPRM